MTSSATPSEGEWSDQFRGLRSQCDEIERLSRAIHEWAWQNVAASDELPRTLPADLRNLLGALQRASAAATSQYEALFERFCRAPALAYLTARTLSVEQYHLLRAQGISGARLDDLRTPDSPRELGA